MIAFLIRFEEWQLFTFDLFWRVAIVYIRSVLEGGNCLHSICFGGWQLITLGQFCRERIDQFCRLIQIKQIKQACILKVCSDDLDNSF